MNNPPQTHYAECRYAECRYAECHYAECRLRSVCTSKLTVLHRSLTVFQSHHVKGPLKRNAKSD